MQRVRQMIQFYRKAFFPPCHPQLFLRLVQGEMIKKEHRFNIAGPVSPSFSELSRQRGGDGGE